jgi:hypothetical protein
MADAGDAWTQIPMPSLIADQIPVRSLRDPESGNESGPIDDPPDVVSEDPPQDNVSVYARQLWTALDQVARYLLDQVARGGSGPVLAEAKPLLDTDDQWLRWSEMYAGVLSVLAGPHGDEGYGQQEARLEYQNRPATGMGNNVSGG